MSSSQLFIRSSIFLAVIGTSLADETFKAKDFARQGLSLTYEETVEYLVYRFDVPLSKIAPKFGQPTFDSKALAVEEHLWFLSRRTGHEAPYTVEELESALPVNPSPLQKYEQKEKWQKIPMVTAPIVQKIVEYKSETGSYLKKFAGTPGSVMKEEKAYTETLPSDGSISAIPRSTQSWGPLRLRRSTWPIMDTWVEMENGQDTQSLTSIKGARIGYSNNYLLGGNGAWSTEGALIWPFHGIYEPNPTDSLLLHAGFATSWKNENPQKIGQASVDELRFGLPIAAVIQQDWMPKRGQIISQLEPYLHTDSHFDAQIMGITAGFEYRGDSWLGQIGNFRPLATIGNRNLDWRIRATGLLDYSEVRQTSPFTQRQLNDDWTRYGVETAFDIGLYDYSAKKLPIILSFSHRFMDTFSGQGGYSDYLKASLSVWLNDYAGITAEYQKGETPVADQAIDLFTIGVEIRY